MSTPDNTFHPDTPHVEIKEGQMTPAASRLTSLDMEKVEQYKMFLPQEGYYDRPEVLEDLDLDESTRSESTRSRKNNRVPSADSYYSHYYSDDEEEEQHDNAAARSRTEQVDRINLSGNLTARAQGYTPRSPKRVVRISPRSEKTFNNWQKYDAMYKNDRKNNLNPLFMSSMCEYDDPWTRECKQR